MPNSMFDSTLVETIGEFLKDIDLRRGKKSERLLAARMSRIVNRRPMRRLCALLILKNLSFAEFAAQIKVKPRHLFDVVSHSAFLASWSPRRFANYVQHLIDGHGFYDVEFVVGLSDFLEDDAQSAPALTTGRRR